MAEPCRVLVVDDAEGLRRLVTLTLGKEEGFEVVAEAEDGETAIARAREVEPDLVLLDVSLPGMGGFEVLERLREEGSDVDVILVSGHEAADLEAKAEAAGALGYIEKSGDPTAFLEEVKAIVAESEDA